jgi:hypothetical protein
MGSEYYTQFQNNELLFKKLVAQIEEEADKILNTGRGTQKDTKELMIHEMQQFSKALFNTWQLKVKRLIGI